MINKHFLIGNLGRDPEISRLESGSVVAKFPVATSESYRDKSGEWRQTTEWHNVVVWGSLAEKAERILTKGAQVYVEGKVTHHTWEDKHGNNRRSTETVASYFRVLSKNDTPETAEDRMNRAKKTVQKWMPDMVEEGKPVPTTPYPGDDNFPF